MCERQRSKLADAGRRARELERLASAAKKETRLAQEQVRVSSSFWSALRAWGGRLYLCLRDNHRPLQAADQFKDVSRTNANTRFSHRRAYVCHPGYFGRRYVHLTPVDRFVFWMHCQAVGAMFLVVTAVRFASVLDLHFICPSHCSERAIWRGRWRDPQPGMASSMCARSALLRQAVGMTKRCRI